MSTRLVLVDPAAERLLAEAGLASYESLADCAQGELIHETRTTRTRRLRLGRAGFQGTYYLKTYRYDSGECRVALRRDKADIEAANYAYLRERLGIRVPIVLAHGSRRKLGRLLDAWLLTRAIPDALPMDAFFSARWPEGRPAERDPLRRRLLERCAELVALMHRGGFFHIDLQWRNLLIAPAGTGDVRIFVLDSPRGGPRRSRLMRDHGRLRDLSSLWKEGARRLTRTEQLRWFERYLGVSRLRPEHREWIRVLARDRSSKERDEPR